MRTTEHAMSNVEVLRAKEWFFAQWFSDMIERVMNERCPDIGYAHVIDERVLDRVEDKTYTVEFYTVDGDRHFHFYLTAAALVKAFGLAGDEGVANLVRVTMNIEVAA